MIPQQENTQFTENNPQSLARKLKVISSNDRVDALQPEEPSIKTKHHNNVIPFRMKTSRKVDSGKSEISENTSVDAKVAQNLVVKQVLNKAINDQDFWVDLLENGSLALSEFNLSSEAKAAIASGDVQWVYDNVADIQKREMAFLYKRLERSV